MDREAWWATIHGVTIVGHDLATKPPPPSLTGHLIFSHPFLPWSLKSSFAALHVTELCCRWPKIKWANVVLSLKCVQIFMTLWTVAHQFPLSMGFSRQEYWSELPFPSPWDLPNPRIETTSLESLVYPFSSGSSWPRNRTGVSGVAGGFFTIWATRIWGIKPVMARLRKVTVKPLVREDMLEVVQRALLPFGLLT